MGTDVLKTFDNLQEELDKAKTNLKGLNENIRRIIGRNPPDNNNSRIERKRTFSDNRGDTNRRGDYNNQPERQRHRDGSPQNKRPNTTKSVFSRLSGPSRDDDKPKLHSRVIRELPTRQEIVAAQGGGDEKSLARNRRMFGCLLGTLQKFCQEESRLKPKEEKKAKIEKKLEEQQLQERENMKKERQNLFSNRKKQQQEIKMIEIKMNRMKELTAWEESKKPLMNFIRTKAKPHIYYKPKSSDKKSDKKLEESKIDLEKLIQKKRQSVNEELAIIEGRFNREPRTYEERIDKNSRLSKHGRNEDDEDDADDDHDYYNNNSDEEENDNQNYDDNPQSILIKNIKIEDSKKLSNNNIVPEKDNNMQQDNNDDNENVHDDPIKIILKKENDKNLQQENNKTTEKMEAN